MKIFYIEKKQLFNNKDCLKKVLKFLIGSKILINFY